MRDGYGTNQSYHSFCFLLSLYPLLPLFLLLFFCIFSRSHSHHQPHNINSHLKPRLLQIRHQNFHSLNPFLYLSPIASHEFKPLKNQNRWSNLSNNSASPIPKFDPPSITLPKSSSSTSTGLSSPSSSFFKIWVSLVLISGTRPQSNNDRPVSVGNSSTKTWAISSIFGSRASSAESSANRSLDETVFDVERMPSVIQLREPPAILRPSEAQTDNEAVEIIVTKLLLSSYYDIVRKNIQDFVPKAIMHFLVNHTKRDLLNTFIQKLYRESLFEEMLQEQHDVVSKRKRTGEVYHVLQQAVQTLDEVEADVSSRGSSLGAAAATSGLLRISGLSSNLYSISNGENRPSYMSTNSAARRVFQFGDQSLPGDSNGGLHRY